jgi:hypothetical protein
VRKSWYEKWEQSQASVEALLSSLAGWECWDSQFWHAVHCGVLQRLSFYTPDGSDDCHVQKLVT